MLKAILFDLDGTLLPMDADEFTAAYFNLLGDVLAPHGYDRKLFGKAMWKGLDAMLNNDGEAINADMFWRAFSSVFGDKVYADMPIFDWFYKNEFHSLKAQCGANPRANEIIKRLKRDGYKVVLATNPVFPFEAYRARTSWTGVDIADFDLVTTYENSHYCKPTAGYYAEIARTIGVNASECLMVGNDVGDDMPAADIGMNVFLMPEHIINKQERSIENYPRGGFDELLDHIVNFDKN